MNKYISTPSVSEILLAATRAVAKLEQNLLLMIDAGADGTFEFPCSDYMMPNMSTTMDDREIFLETCRKHGITCQGVYKDGIPTFSVTL